MLLDRGAVVARLAEDLRTVGVLLTGRRLTQEQCVGSVRRLFAGGAEPADEAVFYLLSTHLLALDEGATLDLLAWEWLSRRDGSGVWTPRSAAVSLRLAVFAVESGWPEATLAKMVGLVLHSGLHTQRKALDDLARTGGRHASHLESVVRASAVGDVMVPATRAARLMLTRCVDLPVQTARLGAGWVLVTNRSPLRRVATLFTWGRGVPADAQRAVWHEVRRQGLAMAVHGQGCRVEVLPLEPGPRAILPLREHPPDGHLRDVLASGRQPAAANIPALLSLPCDRVLTVFSIGSSVVGQARWLATGGGVKRAR